MYLRKDSVTSAEKSKHKNGRERARPKHANGEKALAFIPRFGPMTLAFAWLWRGRTKGHI
jgi:hypothetical protein